MKKSELKKLIRKVIKEQNTMWNSRDGIKRIPSFSKKETVECIQDYECGSSGDNPQCCNSGFCGPCGASMGKHGANINETSVDEIKDLDDDKYRICCCGYSDNSYSIVKCKGLPSCTECCKHVGGEHFTGGACGEGMDTEDGGVEITVTNKRA